MYLLTGTKRWLDLGFIKFQPSEIAKIAFILMLAKIIVQHEQQDWSDKWRSDKQLLKIVAVSVPVFLDGGTKRFWDIPCFRNDYSISFSYFRN